MLWGPFLFCPTERIPALFTFSLHKVIRDNKLRFLCDQYYNSTSTLLSHGRTHKGPEPSEP